MKNVLKVLFGLFALVLLFLLNPSLGVLFATVSFLSVGAILLMGLLGFWVVDRANPKEAQRSRKVVWIARVVLLVGLIAPPANGYKSMLILAAYFVFVRWYKKHQKSVAHEANSNHES